jgi:hypothetical protein
MKNACNGKIDINTRFDSMKKSMKKYPITANGTLQVATLILAMNSSVGIDGAETIFFLDTVDHTSFKLTTMTNFWTSNIQGFDTGTAIDVISDFIINEGNRAKNISGNKTDSFFDYYSLFANPYANFIVDFLFCNINPTINFDSTNDNLVISQNFLRFIDGQTTGDFGGTRGAGTLNLCNYCHNFLNVNEVKDIYGYISTKDYIQQFCGCCSFLNDSQPAIYNQKETEVSLVCQPICHKNEVIKAYNGAGDLVNNGYPDSNNTSDSGTRSYTRRQCIGQTVCVIDIKSVKLIGGQNKVEFNQVCPGCNQDGSCICYIDTTDGTIDTITNGVDGLQNSVVFKQNCPVSFCSKANVNGGPPTFVPCNVYNPSDTGKDPNSNYNHDGKVNPNGGNDNRIKYIFGIQNWLVPIVFLSILIFVSLSLLIVNVSSIRKQIFMVNPNHVALKSMKDNIKDEKGMLMKELGIKSVKKLNRSIKETKL